MSWTSRPPRPTQPSIVVVTGATIAMSVKSKCIAASTTALNATPLGSRVNPIDPALVVLLNELARVRLRPPRRCPRKGARSDSHESVRPRRPSRCSEISPSASPSVGGLTASRISVHPELLPERWCARSPLPPVPGSIPAGSEPPPPKDPEFPSARLRSDDLLADFCDPKDPKDPSDSPPPPPIAAKLSCEELRGCCGRLNTPLRTDVGDTGGDPAW
mmetsp:Transcript_12469/g.57745  ORF Transcript_12469/g.57745 Transcript_12469/m.57745 type:complete len:217 (+) Transcript_12469:764-1414(+)